MDNVVSIELFGQTYNFKTDLDPEVSREAVELLRTSVAKLENDALVSSIPLSERPIMLMMAALDLASENVRLQKQRQDLQTKITSCADNLINKLKAQTG